MFQGLLSTRALQLLMNIENLKGEANKLNTWKGIGLI